MTLDEAIEKFSRLASAPCENRKDFAQVTFWLNELKKIRNAAKPFIDAAPKTPKHDNLVWYSSEIPSMKTLFAGDFTRLKESIRRI